jgi:glycerol uptake facilitator-like aquaporin
MYGYHYDHARMIVMAIQEFLGVLLLYLWFFPSYEILVNYYGWDLQCCYLVQWGLFILLDMVTEGAGFNPSMNLMLYVDGVFEAREAIVRSFAAILGSMAALYVNTYACGSTMVNSDPHGHKYGNEDDDIYMGVGKEFIGTAILTIAILYVPVFGDYGRPYLATAFRIISIYCLDPCFNPLIAYTFYFYNHGAFSIFTDKYCFASYIIAPTLGALAGLFFFKNILESKPVVSEKKKKN